MSYLIRNADGSLSRKLADDLPHDPLGPGGYLRLAIHDAAARAAARAEKAHETAFGRVYLAWEVEGPVPEHHRRAKARLRAEWPALAGALDLLSATIRNDPEPRR